MHRALNANRWRHGARLSSRPLWLLALIDPNKNLHKRTVMKKSEISSRPPDLILLIYENI